MDEHGLQINTSNGVHIGHDIGISDGIVIVLVCDVVVGWEFDWE